jgi:dTMP kinase
MRGKLIVLDGNDGSGKYTQAELLAERLREMGHQVLLLSFPDYQTFFGWVLKKALDGEYPDFANMNPYAASAIYAINRMELVKRMTDFIEEGGIVVCDRYVSANEIHQGGKIKDHRERLTFLSWVEDYEYEKIGIPRPDISIYLDVPPAVSRALMSDKTWDTVENNPQYLENSHRSAQWLIAREPHKWLHVRCATRGLMCSREEIHHEILAGLLGRKIL